MIEGDELLCCEMSSYRNKKINSYDNIGLTYLVGVARHQDTVPGLLALSSNQLIDHEQEVKWHLLGADHSDFEEPAASSFQLNAASKVRKLSNFNQLQGRKDFLFSRKRIAFFVIK